MNSRSAFGGKWTVDKLERLRKYPQAYTKIFKANSNAMFYKTVYVDAFASSGFVVKSNKGLPENPALVGLADEDAKEYIEGSARIALAVEPGFDTYLFIEINKKKAAELRKLRNEYPNRAGSIQVVNDEANSFLRNWCRTTDWRNTRAVVFLDPFGMQVEWSLLEAIAMTKAIDLWLLFPIGAGVMRMLPGKRLPPPEWEERLTSVFGTSEWQNFYVPQTTLTLFGEEEAQVREADYGKLAEFFVQRLKTIFPGVAENPRLMENSKNVPLYLLCFATSNPNPKAIKPALRIAQDILRRN